MNKPKTLFCGFALVLALVVGVAFAQINSNRQAGDYIATAYNYDIDSSFFSNLGGPYTFTLGTCQNALPFTRSRNLDPFNTNASVLIIDANPANTETVAFLSQSFTTGYCILNLATTKQHTSYHLKSGTYGLQEAINDATSTGGGNVVVDTQWGGTTGMITGAAGNANVSITDTRTGSVLYSWTGSAYAPLAVAPPFGAVSPGTNTGALIIGNGGSLSTSGSGTIAATTAISATTAASANALQSNAVKSGAASVGGQSYIWNATNSDLELQTKPFLDVRDFPGASVGAQIDNACASGTGNAVFLAIPSTVGAGNSIVGVPDRCKIEDYRQIGAYDWLGLFNGGIQGDTAFFGRYITGRGVANVGPFVVTAWDVANGVNQTGGPKSNYTVGNFLANATTQGQINGIGFTVQHGASNGDTIGISGVVNCSGGANAVGDQGCQAIAAGALQANTDFTGTISGIAGNVISYTGGANEGQRGEAGSTTGTSGYLIDLSRAYTTGTISSISGQPAVVVGSGTTWTSSPCLNRRFLASSFPSNTSTAMRYPARHASRQRARRHGDRVDSRDKAQKNEK